MPNEPLLYQVEGWNEPDWDPVPAECNYGISSTTARRVAEFSNDQSGSELFDLSVSDTARVITLRPEGAGPKAAFNVWAEPSIDFHATEISGMAG